MSNGAALPAQQAHQCLQPNHKCSKTALRQAPVAQLDRVLDSDSRGRRFESCRARHLLDHFPNSPACSLETVPMIRFHAGVSVLFRSRNKSFHLRPSLTAFALHGFVYTESDLIHCMRRNSGYCKSNEEFDNDARNFCSSLFAVCICRHRLRRRL